MTYQLGEKRRGNEIGYKNKYSFYRWQSCPDCGKERWVHITKTSAGQRCLRCYGPYQKRIIGKNGNRNLTTQGYVAVRIYPEDFYYNMANHDHYVMEHRLVMAKSLGRSLQPFEIVHHKNGDRQDNRLENLELSMAGAHTIAHSKGYRDGYTKGLIDGRDKQIQELKILIEEQTKQIKLLQWQIKEDKITCP